MENSGDKRLRARSSLKKVIELEMYVLVLSTSFVREISHSKRIHREIITNVYRSSCEIPVALVRF